MKQRPENFLSRYNSIVQSFKMLISSGWLSLLIILIITLLLSVMDQGGTLVIDLLESPLNVSLLLVLSVSLSLVLSHYPDYLVKRGVESKKRVMRITEVDNLKWKMYPQNWFVGFVTYEYNKRPIKNKTTKRFDLMKRMLGSFLLWAVLFTVVSAYKSYINRELSMTVFTVVSLTIVIGHYIYLYKLKKTDKNKRRLVKYLSLGFWLSVILGLVTIYMSWISGWSASTFFCLIVLYSVFIFTYNIFRNVRYFIQFYPRTWPLSLMSNDRYFVMYIGFCGWLSVIVFVLSQFYVFMFNPIILVLALLYAVYGFVIHPIKHQMYYAYRLRKGINESRWNLPRYAALYLVPISVILFIVLIAVSIKTGNDLHTLSPVKENSAINEVEYRAKLYDQLLQDDDSTIYFIASYGGGLMANAWNSLLLDTLANYNGKNILNSTVAMSGVSGGAMGQGMYTAIHKNNLNPAKRKKVIENIAKGNFLSLDIAYMFGFDFIREWAIWDNYFKPNRAKRSMNEYQRVIGDPNMASLSFREYWQELFDKSYHPVLLVNTTSTHSTRGISCSVKLDDFKRAFPGAENILDTEKDDGMSLCYSDALSTTNRFPFLSPAAKIKGHGHYVDGGYFENSGMLSLYNFYEYLASDLLWQQNFKNHKVVFIQIMNGKESQITELVKDKDNLVQEIKESGEISSVINTIVSISGVPRYVNAHVKNDTNVCYVPISLPYYLNTEDFGAYFDASKLSSEVDSIAAKNNRQVDKMRYIYSKSDWETAEPPLARLLSEPALNYMKAVLRDGRLFDELQTKLDED